MTAATTITDLLVEGADDAIAIGAPLAIGLTYAGLREHVNETVAALNEAGIGRGDRVAIVLPNGPEMAAAFVSIAAGATSAPLNPQYRFDEFEFYLTDLNAKALVVEAGASSVATDVASKLGLPVIGLKATPSRGAGRFALEFAEGARSRATPRGGPAGASDIALVLHTSGTTSRPKIVPLTQTNVAASARNVSGTLALTLADRGLVVMPLFHIHGLIAGVLAPLSVGGSIFCAPGFNALKFFGWMEEIKPTWYTAVPTMHQAILARARHNTSTIAATRLRFIRSSSSSLPPQVLAELESTFSTRVIESYGMTEAAHQMTSNLLAPGVRKPGTVGVAAGPEVAIMDEVGRILAQGESGEIVIRGDNVTLGYENNPRANAEGFSGGWFRTGDQGRMDDDGFLTITGRLKEIINRGGEKISPREVDEVLMDHPAVMQVVTFATAHDMLGEEVAAAIVLRDGETVTDRELREFVASRLADFKVPRKIVFLDEIPKGATGKLQRIGLAQKLGL
jgi:acyl-CoA synthetase (AMP-forming)/AMP-acid ligase II